MEILVGKNPQHHFTEKKGMFSTEKCSIKDDLMSWQISRTYFLFWF